MCLCILPQPSVNGAIFLPGTLRYTEVLSSDLQKNILAALLRLGAVRKIKGYVGFDRARAVCQRTPKVALALKFQSQNCRNRSVELRKIAPRSRVFPAQSRSGEPGGQQGDGELVGGHSG